MDEEVYFEDEYELSTEELIMEWKRAYGEIYYIEINDIGFYFKLMGFSEWNLLLSSTDDNFQIEEEICARCILDPTVEDWSNEIYAGFVETLAGKIHEHSMLGENSLESVKNRIEINENLLETNFHEQRPLFIKKCFPEFSLEEILSWNIPKQLDYYSKAKWMLEMFDDMKFEMNK